MAINLYSTAALMGLVSAMDRPATFMLDLYFPQEMTFETEEVYIDKLDRARRLAPYVSPKVEGKIMRNRGSTTRVLTPAYLKPKHAVEPAKAFQRAPGESLGGLQLSPEQRFQMAVADNLQLEDEEITRREELMACEMITTGGVTVESDDHPTLQIDLGRDAALEDALTSTARWGESGVSPMEYVRTRAALVASKSGAAARHVILDPLAALIFQKDAEVRSVLDNRRQASGSMELSGLNAGGAQGEEAVYLGTIGQFDFWQYQQIYTSATGAESKMIPDYSCIVGSPKQAEGVRAYGAIQDTKAALKAVSRFPKMWDAEDPSITTTMTQSAPLPVLCRPDAVSFSTVR